MRHWSRGDPLKSCRWRYRRAWPEGHIGPGDLRLGFARCISRGMLGRWLAVCSLGVAVACSTEQVSEQTAQPAEGGGTGGAPAAGGGDTADGPIEIGSGHDDSGSGHDDSGGGPDDSGSVGSGDGDSVEGSIDDALDASGSDADATMPGPPGWGIRCGDSRCDPPTQFCCLDATPSCLPHGSTACPAHVTTLECDDRGDCCDESGCGLAVCCAYQNGAGPAKARCGGCKGDQVQNLCDPQGTLGQCGGGGPTHAPRCLEQNEDAGSPRLIPGYSYCIPT